MVFMCLQCKSFENTVGKGETAHNVLFLLFPQCFLSISKTFWDLIKSEIIICKLFSLDKSKICHLAKGERSVASECCLKPVINSC